MQIVVGAYYNTIVPPIKHGIVIKTYEEEIIGGKIEILTDDHVWELYMGIETYEDVNTANKLLKYARFRLLLPE